MSESDGALSVVSTTMRSVAICGRDEWRLLMPEHRAARPEWPWWEKPRLESMWHNIALGDVVYDIGTEEGDQSALYARWAGAFGGIVLVEPNPHVWANVRAIFEANAIKHPLATWVGFAGAKEYVPTPDRMLDGTDHGLCLGPGWPACAHGPMIGDHGFLNLCERPDVPVTTIDRIADSTSAPDAITIDVEGAELRVLQGALITLEQAHPHVWVSIHPQFSVEMYGTTRDDVFDFMAELGYRGEHLAAEHEHHVFFWHPSRAHVLPYGG